MYDTTVNSFTFASDGVFVLPVAARIALDYLEWLDRDLSTRVR